MFLYTANSYCSSCLSLALLLCGLYDNKGGRAGGRGCLNLPAARGDAGTEENNYHRGVYQRARPGFGGGLLPHVFIPNIDDVNGVSLLHAIRLWLKRHGRKKGKEKDKPTARRCLEEQVSLRVNLTSLPSDTLASGSTRETVGTPTLVPGHAGTCTRPSPPPYFALPTHLAMLPGSSQELVGWRRLHVSPAPTAGCSPATVKGNFSQLLPTLRSQQSSSSAPSAPNSHRKMHFDFSDPLTAPAASSRLCWWSFKASTPPVGACVAQVRTKQTEPLTWDDPQDL